MEANVRSFLVVALMLVCRCSSRSVPEAVSVVSVYTTQPTTAGTSGLDVYQQIATNIAERITSPIYRFLGISKNNTEDNPLTKRPWGKIELLDEPEEVTKSAKPVNNDISDDRSIEELSVEALKKIDMKPEKLTLYSSYLPTSGKLKKNDTINDIDNVDIDDDDEPFGFDDIQPQSRDGPFVFILEWLGSLVQLAWGAFDAIFKPSTANNNSNSGTDN